MNVKMFKYLNENHTTTFNITVPNSKLSENFKFNNLIQKKLRGTLLITKNIQFHGLCYFIDAVFPKYVFLVSTVWTGVDTHVLNEAQDGDVHFTEHLRPLPRIQQGYVLGGGYNQSTYNNTTHKIQCPEKGPILALHQ